MSESDRGGKLSAKRLERRQDILAAATVLFSRQGYHATGVAELSEAVGLGAGALYHHMGSKEELLYDVCAPAIRAVLDFGPELLAMNANAEEKIRLLARRHMRNVHERQLELRIALREVDSLTGQRGHDMQELRDATENLWEDIIDQGVESGELSNVTPLFVKFLLGALNYTVIWYDRDGALSPDEIADQVVEMVLTNPAHGIAPSG
ncbi:TetR/AcrR family transcriptional regulator [Rhodococcus opacus]|uniref:TetR/AcrR family transcriptional regulator n=1 Tax=Rhodococcus opacus TaxID=37919 RepID=UPI0018E45564|nr:TetR/AcrR family transcriptional regulator [Rhodococcus opacus]